MRIAAFCVGLAVAAGLSAAYDNYLSAKHKFDAIESDRLRPGSRVELTVPELQAYVAREAPDGVRNPDIRLEGGGLATGSALIDFTKLQRAQGHPPGWLMSMLLAGERPVSVTARIRSANGQATVDVQRVQISGMEIEGPTLDFLIHNFLLPLYPDAKVGQPFELAHRVERIDVQQSAVEVVIGR